MKRFTLIALIAAGVAVLLLLNFGIYVKVVQPVLAARSSIIIAGPSMEPTLKAGDQVRMQAPKGDLQRGDVVVVTDPTTPTRLMVKRIIGVGGDRVEMRHGAVILNSNPLDEPYANANWKGDMAPIQVPAGQLFLLGDNRGMSFDSRNFGPVPVANVKAVIAPGK